MSLEQELVKLVQRYLASQVTFEELAAWENENENETELLEYGPQSIAGQLAGSISITDWEIGRGDRPPETALEAMSGHSAEIARTHALP